MKRYEFGYNKYDNCVEPVPESYGSWVTFEDMCYVIDTLLSMDSLTMKEKILKLEKKFPILKGELNDSLL